MERNINKMSLKVKLYLYTIVYAKNCSATLQDARGDSIFIEKGGLFFIERNLNLKVFLNKIHNTKPYEVYSISNEILQNLIKVFDNFYGMNAVNNRDGRRIHDKIFSIKGTETNIELFNMLSKSSDDVYTLVHLLSKVKTLEKLYVSLRVSGSNFFTDKVRGVIEHDLSKKWRLSSVSDELNISEVAVRKKLEGEGVTFNQLLLDVRMKHSANLILNCDHHINKVASIVGISSVSYFIKIFSRYYGVTPKQFYIYHKSSK